MKYYISDLHFGHEKIIQYENRPFQDIGEMTASYITKWNSKVKKGDEVYILGDFSFYKGLETNAILHLLNGMKFLIKGNHDHTYLDDNDFNEDLFVWVKDYHKVKDDGDIIILFHYPIQTWDKKHHGSLHFYGHVHSNNGTSHPIEYDIPNSYNVGIDILKEPMTKNEILKFYGKED